MCFNPNSNNMLAAVLERQKFVKGPSGLFVKPPQPNRALFFQRLSLFRLKLLKRTRLSARLSRTQFLSECPPDKQKVYATAIASLESEPLNRKDAHIKAFPKYEKLIQLPGKTLVPRCISPRSPRFNVEIGTFLRPMERNIYDGIARVFRRKTVSKGDNAQDMGALLLRKWRRFKNPVAIGLDASRFDQHVSKVALQWTHSIYLELAETDKEVFKSLLRQTLINKCTYSSADGFIKWVSEGGRMSGDMDTSLGNCLLMCAMIWSYMHEIGIHKFELYNNGDDCVLIFEREHLNIFMPMVTTWFLEMGFNMKVETPVYKFEHIEFCQTHPIMTSAGPICVRNYPACVDKDVVSVLPIDTQDKANNYYASIGKGGLALAGGIPILSSFYNRLIEWSEGAEGWGNHPSLKSGMIHMSIGMTRSHTTPDWESRVSFYEAFGVTPDEQIAIEEYYRRLPRPQLGREIFEFPVLPHFAYLGSSTRA